MELKKEFMIEDNVVKHMGKIGAYDVYECYFDLYNSELLLYFVDRNTSRVVKILNVASQGGAGGASALEWMLLNPQEDSVNQGI